MTSDAGKGLIIFGAGDAALVAAHYAIEDAGRKVSSFTVDRRFCTMTDLNGIPVVPFDEIESRFDPSKHEMLLPLGWTAMNAFRRDRLFEARAKGYAIAKLLTSCSVVASGCAVGDNTNVYQGSVVGPWCTLGEDIQMRAGGILSHHVTVGDHAFFGSGVIVGGRVSIGERCVIGMGAVLRSGVRIAERCFIGAGALVLADTEPDGVYLGHPARRVEMSPMDASSSGA